MKFKITGCIYEKESGLVVEDLMIRAYDKDLLYDDLLGTAYLVRILNRMSAGLW